MRLSAYKRAIDEAMKLPTSIPTMESYFRTTINSRDIVLNRILTKAREDIKGLFSCEFVELYEYQQEKGEKR